MAEREVTINWNGQQARAVIVPIDSIDERQSHYQLADGTSLTMRSVVAQVLRLKEHYDAEGQPIYVVKSQNFVIPAAPDNLRKPG